MITIIDLNLQDLIDSDPLRCASVVILSTSAVIITSLACTALNYHRCGIKGVINGLSHSFTLIPLNNPAKVQLIYLVCRIVRSGRVDKCAFGTAQTQSSIRGLPTSAIYSATESHSCAEAGIETRDTICQDGRLRSEHIIRYIVIPLVVLFS